MRPARPRTARPTGRLGTKRSGLHRSHARRGPSARPEGRPGDSDVSHRSSAVEAPIGFPRDRWSIGTQPAAIGLALGLSTFFAMAVDFGRADLRELWRGA